MISLWKDGNVERSGMQNSQLLRSNVWYKVHQWFLLLWVLHSLSYYEDILILLLKSIQKKTSGPKSVVQLNLKRRPGRKGGSSSLECLGRSGQTIKEPEGSCPYSSVTSCLQSSLRNFYLLFVRPQPSWCVKVQRLIDHGMPAHLEL